MIWQLASASASRLQIAMAYDSISNDKVRLLLLANNDDLKSQLSSADNVLAETKMSANACSTYSIIDIDPKMSAEQILPTIIGNYKGKHAPADKHNESTESGFWDNRFRIIHADCFYIINF